MKHGFVLLFAFAGLLQAQTARPGESGSGWAWAVPVVGILGGGLLIGMSILNGRKAKASVEWPSVPGAVISSVMVTDTNSGDIATFTPVVTYNYVVNGQTLQCDRVRFSPA